LSLIELFRLNVLKFSTRKDAIESVLDYVKVNLELLGFGHYWATLVPFISLLEEQFGLMDRYQDKY